MPSPMKHNKQLRRLAAVLMALVLIFGAMTATSRQRSDVTVVEKAIATLLYPLQVATDWVAGRFRGVGETISELRTLMADNARLLEEVHSADQLAARNEQLIQENQTLRNELKMKERAQYPFLTAEVISRTSDNWYRTVQINRGSRDGVQTNMAVVNWQGLVGKVSATTPYTATVQLVTDAGFGQTGFGTGVKVPTGELGVIETVQGGEIRMKFYSSEPDVKVGQPIFTSGQAYIPADLLIGYVGAVGGGDSTVDRFVTVRPAVDFHKLDVLQVVLHPTDRDRGSSSP
jgi:rod shape-determining protein MreC